MSGKQIEVCMLYSVEVVCARCQIVDRVSGLEYRVSKMKLM